MVEALRWQALGSNLNEWDGEETPAFQSLVEDLGAVLGPPPRKEEERRQAEGEAERKKEAEEKRRLAQAEEERKAEEEETRQQAQPTPKRRPSAKPPEELKPGTVKLNPKEGLEYVWIPPGTFQMGCVPGDKTWLVSAEKPRHAVTITKGFWMARTPVTVEAYRRFAKAARSRMPKAPDFNAEWKHRDDPIVNVSWDDARRYCAWAGGRLPTEAEWEYAARGGMEGTKYPWGNEISLSQAHYHSKDGTKPVAQYAPNGYGLYDVCGNVWEWLQDWYGEKQYSGPPKDDPAGPRGGQYRVVRGGSWANFPRFLRVSDRLRIDPGRRVSNIGFRCAREVFS